LISDVVEVLTGTRGQQAASADGDDLVFHADDHSFLSPTILLRRQLYPAMAAATPH
jgi:hypothetical protein